MPTRQRGRLAKNGSSFPDLAVAAARPGLAHRYREPETPTSPDRCRLHKHPPSCPPLLTSRQKCRLGGAPSTTSIADLPVTLSIAGMRRQKLVWFAAGAACSSIAAVGAALALRSPPQEQGWFLRIAEQGQSLRDGQRGAIWRGAEIARDCGARSFEAMPGVGSDQTDSTRIPLIPDNNPALGCVVERATDAGLWIGVQLEPPTPGGLTRSPGCLLPTHSRSPNCSPALTRRRIACRTTPSGRHLPSQPDRRTIAFSRSITQEAEDAEERR